MKKLTPDEIENLTEKQASAIAESFGNFLQKPGLKMLAFESELEYDRESTLLALLFLLEANHKDEVLVKNICNNIHILFSFFMSDPDSYQKTLQTKELMDQISNF